MMLVTSRYTPVKALPVTASSKIANKKPNPILQSISNIGTPVIANVLLASPVYAGAGKIFDFNATLPIMAAQFLLLMVFLDKTWFGPVGKVLDERDAKIRARLSSVTTGAEELEGLKKEAETLLKDARAEAQASVTEAKNKTSAKIDAELAAEKSLLDANLARAVKDLESERNAAQGAIDEQVSELSKYIIERVLPAGFSI